MVGQQSYAQRAINLLGRSSFVGYWPLWETSGVTAYDIINGHNGVYRNTAGTLNGITLGQPGVGDGRTCAAFDGTNGYCDISSAATTFNGSEGGILAWAKVSAAAVWTDGIGRDIFRGKVDASNQIGLTKPTTNNIYDVNYQAGGIVKEISPAAFGGMTGWMMVGLGWSKSGDVVKYWMNGGQIVTPLNTLGAWAGTPASNQFVIGARITTPTNCWKGSIAHFMILNRIPTQAEVATIARGILPCTNAENASAAHAASYLSIPTYDGSNQLTHPDVEYQPTGWNEKKYWMGFTPYPGENSTYENPSIESSMDGVTWAVPNGLTNPIDAYPSPSYNSDSALIIGQDNKLYCYYRETNGINSDKINVRSSPDGVTWSAEATLLTGGQNTMISPSILWDGTQYVMFYVNLSSLKMRTCSTPDGTWSAEIPCAMAAPAGKNLWHVTVRKKGGEYHALMLTSEVSGPNRLYFGVSRDKISWVMATNQLLGPGTTGAWDDTNVYRAAMLPNGLTGYEIWYPGKNVAGEWRVGRTLITGV